MASRTPTDPEAGPVSVASGDTASEVTPTLKVQLRKKDFVERVVERSGLRRGDARTAVDAVLAILGEALVAGEEVNLPPLGKARMTREKATPRGHAYTLRLVRNAADMTSQEGLAQDDKDG